MTWDPKQQLHRHAEAYARTHDGRHPYTDAWPWATAIVAWREQATRTSWRGNRYLYPEHRDLVVAGVAEALRLSMSHRGEPIGDLPVDLHDELAIWLYNRTSYPVPGSEGWPAPTGPYAPHWHTLMDLVRSGERLGRNLVHAASDALQVLALHGGYRPYLRSGARDEMDRRRTTARGSVDTIRFAEVTPSLIVDIPVPVEDASLYAQCDGLNLTIDALTAPA